MSAVQGQLKEGLIAGFRYHIEDLLGVGDNGDVYVCRDLKEEKSSLAIKILSPIFNNSEHTESFSRKLALLQRLRHPNIIRIFDFGIMENSRELFLIEEFIHGQDLYAGTADAKTESILRICVEILKSIHYLHVRGIIHGNLKPSNVWITNSSENKRQIKLLDFNLQCHGIRFHEQDGIKSIAYLAPEILLGNCAGKPADLYALGIMIYQLLTRRLPFEDEDRGFLSQKLLQGAMDMNPLKRLKHGAPIIGLLQRMLEKDPGKRIGSASEVIDFLETEILKDSHQNAVSEMECHFDAAPFVGRDKEMRWLLDKMRLVKETGRGRTVFLAGEAGSGKTRCSEELRSWACLDGWRIVEGTCRLGEESAYGPYIQVLNPMESAIRKPGVAADQSSKIAEAGLLDVSSEFAAGQFQDSLTRQLVQQYGDRPTLFFLHDFHLANKATWAVLDFLSSDIQGVPMFLCVSLRPAEVKNGKHGRNMASIVHNGRGEMLALKPLTQNHIQQLIVGMTGEDASQASWGERLFRMVGGNPFFLEEILKNLAEQGLLIYKAGKWNFPKQILTGLDAPAGVETILQKRIDCLSPAAKSLGGWLALFHHATTRAILASVMSSTPDRLEESLMELEHRQMIQWEKIQSEEIVDFSHELIAEVMRGNLSVKSAQRMHSKIAETLERECGVAGHLHELAMHYMEGLPNPRSIHYALTSADQYRAEFAHENALRCFEHVFQNRTGLTQEKLCAAAIAASDSMFALGLAQQAVPFLDSILKECHAIGPELQARMHMQLALSYQYIGDFALQEAQCHAGLEILQQYKIPEPNLTQAMLWVELAFSCMVQSRPQQGLECMAKAQKACPENAPVALQGRIQNLYAALYRVNCDLINALTSSKKAVDILESSEEYHLLCSAYSTLGFVLLGIGRFSEALEQHHKAVLLSENGRSVVLRAQALGNMAECLCRMGRIQEALNAIHSALQAVYESNNPAVRQGCETILAEIQLASGDYRAARQTIESLMQRDANLTLFTGGYVLYVAAAMHYFLGNFAESLRYIDQLNAGVLPDAPLYEYELAQAIRARIDWERGFTAKAIDLLKELDRDVAGKHWPYHRCLIKLYYCEVLIEQERWEDAAKCAHDVLRLAKAMNTSSLQCHGHLLLGIIHSPVRRYSVSVQSGALNLPATGIHPDASSAIEELLLCCRQTDPPCPSDLQWRAQAELSFIYRSLGSLNLSFQYAQKAYDCLCRLEDKIPADLMASFYRVFNRSLVKMELMKLMETGRRNADSCVHEASRKDTALILRRLSASINAYSGKEDALEKILEQLLSAIDMQQGFIYLADEEKGSLSLAKGRNFLNEPLSSDKGVPRKILQVVYEKGTPFISANALQDSRIPLNCTENDSWGQVYCGALKVSSRTIGVLVAGHSLPADSLSAPAIDIFAAACNLAAMAIDKTANFRCLHSDLPDQTRKPVPACSRYPEIVGKSAQVEALKDRIQLAADSPLDILLSGESGTGKELVARAISRTGRRRQGKFVPVDCGSLSDTLVEAELFGYRKGAFTGAIENRQGLLEAANGGIVFLDEISNMPLRLQAKLLRVLQEREVRRIGETTSRKLDIQVIAATNKDLLEEIQKDQFRGDLYYRLKAMEIRLPSLRERFQDIPLLLEWFLEQIAIAEGGRNKQFTSEALRILKDYRYPGNIRELRNIVSSSYYATSGAVMGRESLPPEVLQADTEIDSAHISTAEKIYRDILAGKGAFNDLIKVPYLKHRFGSAVLREIIEKSLKDTNGVYREALKLLGVSSRSYPITLQFLKRHQCYPDFRSFRRKKIIRQAERQRM